MNLNPLVETTELEEFFGCRPSQVAPIILSAVVASNRAEWFRGAKSISDLPRHVMPPARDQFHSFSCRDRSDKDILIWIMENTQGRWGFGVQRIYFEDVLDAITYRLRWG